MKTSFLPVSHTQFRLQTKYSLPKSSLPFASSSERNSPPNRVTLLTPQSVAAEISITLEKQPIPANRHLFISNTLRMLHKKQENGQSLSAQEQAQLLAIATYFDSPNLVTIVHYWGIQARKKEQALPLSEIESVMLRLLQQYAYTTELETLFMLSLKQKNNALTPSEAQQLSQLLSRLPKETIC